MMSMPRFVLAVLLVFTTLFAAKAQNDIVDVISLDEFVVSAGLDSFDVDGFVKRVREDTTFYQAFLNLKYFPHEITGAMVVFHKDESERGTMKRRATQHLDGDERMWVDITFEETNGRIRKRNGEWRYLTAEMYDDIFFPTTPHKVSNTMVSHEQELVSGSRMDKHKAQLKRMMFNPGAEIENVPFIGDKLAIFDDHMVPYYDYAIFSATLDTTEVIAFSCLTKAGMEDETVIHDLTSYFDPETFEVLAREYRLAHNTLFFSFDISMRVENTRQDGWLLPTKVWYNGYWNALFKKPEIINFEMRCKDYLTRVGRYAGAER